MKTNCWLTR